MLLINSIPKSGTNLVKNIVCALMPRAVDAGRVDVFNLEGVDRLHKMRRALRIERGIYTTHCPYDAGVAAWLREEGIRTVLLYRDPRDVAVSQWHYIYQLRRGGHVCYQDFASLPDDAARLMAAIEGFGDPRIVSPGNLPSTPAFFQMYAGWRREQGVLQLTYEEAVRGDAARKLADWLGLQGVNPRAATARALAQRPHTFRHGVPGDWRREFTDAHLAAFHALGGEQLLQEWGYASETVR